MAVKNLETLVLCGNRVVGDVVNSRALMGSDAVKGQTPRIMSHPRRLSQRFSGPCYKAKRRPVIVVAHDEDAAVARAGRSWGRSGVLVRRSPAMAAGRTVLSRWSQRHLPAWFMPATGALSKSTRGTGAR
jgi:hypothetical protein